MNTAVIRREIVDVRSRRARGFVVAGLFWAALVATTHLWGTALVTEDSGIKLHAPPLFGHFDPRFGLKIVPAAVVALIVVGFGPLLTKRLPWRGLLLVCASTAAVWAVALAYVNGIDALSAPLERSTEYLSVVPQVSSVGAFVAGYIAELPGYPIHVKGHPPGAIVLLTWLERIGLGGSAWAAALVIAAGASTVPAVLIALRTISSEERARRSALFLVLAPAALWIATSMDALFAGVSAGAVALVVVALTRSGTSGDVWAAAGGLLGGCALLLSYGAAPLVAIPAAVGLARRRLRPLVIAAVAAGVLLVASAAWGFSWPQGLLATENLYRAGVASDRPYAFFVVANLAAFGLAVGPATAAGLTRVFSDRGRLLVLGALTAVIAADLSGLSKGEVERIWLPFAPWMLLAAGELPESSTRAWLALQALIALGIAVFVRTPW
ncbi:MAG: hypothetical protein M3454_11845 [Actinomycetota bacterium]|nr:hypothetical protein [Actinomycetota bacterium]